MSFARRADLLRSLGVDEVQRLEPTASLLESTPPEFFERLAREYRPAHIVEGRDFRFGRGRAGDVALLASLGAQAGVQVEVVAPVEASLHDQSVVVVSSTLIRWLISRGRVADAALLLGRPHELTGEVCRGDRRGREIGFPTANVVPHEVLPADGVYAGRAELADGRTFAAAIHIGPRATFDDERRTVEAYFLDWAGPLSEGAPEYGWPVRLHMHSWLRDQARFDSIAELVEQIHRDVERTREALARHDSAGNGRRMQEAPA